MAKTGLVLEGGGVRGIYTAGVLDVFMEQGIQFDGVVGVSAGAVHGCSFLSGQRGRSIRYYKKYCRNPRFMSMRSWLKTGNVVETEFCYHELPDTLDPYDHQAFQACQTPFYAVCSNLETGEPEYIQITDMRSQIDVIRASASLPYFSQIVTVDGKPYLDGGCTDSIPAEAFRSMGYDRSVCVLTRPAGYQKSPARKGLDGWIYRKYPRFVQALRSRHQVYNQSLDFVRQGEERGELFVICPSVPPNVGRLETDPEKIQRVYDLGRADAEARLAELKDWLNRA